MAAWEVTSSAFVFFIFLLFFIGFQVPDDKKYVALKMLFIWLGFTMIIPFLGIQYLIANEHLSSVANLYLGITMVYLPIYIFLVYILFVLYFKDVIQFFKASVKGFKGNYDDTEFIDEV